MTKHITHLKFIIDIEQDDGDEYRLEAGAGELGEATPEELQDMTSQLVDQLLRNEGMIEVTRKEMEKRR